MGMLDKAAVSRRMCPVIFLLDTSGSMYGEPIGAVNAAMEGVLPELISMNDNNADVEVAVAIMTFDWKVNWMTDNGLVNPSNYNWRDLNAEGGTSMGEAFVELNKALSINKGIMNRASGSVAPVLFLLSDGEPSDEYKQGLQALKENNWYKVAAKVAIGYGDSNDSVLEEFTGNRETVLHTNDPKRLQSLIKFVTITSAMVASKGTNTSTSATNSADTSIDQNDTTNALATTLKESSPTLLAISDDPDEEW